MSSIQDLGSGSLRLSPKFVLSESSEIPAGNCIIPEPNISGFFVVLLRLPIEDLKLCQKAE